MTILIADDHETNRKLLRALLQAEGYKTVEVLDGAEALKWLLETPSPAVGLIDWEMPGMDGVEVCRQARLRVNAPPTYLILLTIRDTNEDILGGLLAGANDYVTKPFVTHILLSRVKTAVEMMALQQARLNPSPKSV